MFEKIIEFISKKNINVKSISSPIILETGEQKIINDFIRLTEEMKVNEKFPQRGIQSLEFILKILIEINYDSIEFEEQSLIRKIIEKEIPQMIDIYLSLPKAHAVSIILENGKTSKDTLLNKLITLSKQLEKIWDATVLEKTQELVKKEKNISKISVIKKDFFEM